MKLRIKKCFTQICCMKTDITSEEDIRLMVDSFYTKVNADELLSPIFNDIAKINWNTHLPRMYNFWNTILFFRGDYKGNPFEKHSPLPIHAEHFSRWLLLFHTTIDELFDGPNAEEAKLRARTIGWTFQSKMELLNQHRKNT